MDRRRRILLNTATVLSLALCVTVAGLRIQPARSVLLLGHASRQVSSGFLVERDTGLFSSGRGELGFVNNVNRESLNTKRPAPRPFDRRGLMARPGLMVGPYRDGDDLLIEMGFGFGRVTYNWTVPNQDTRQFVIVPHWFALLITGALPLGRCLRWTGWRPTFHRHPNSGLCIECGYDLRATPDRCPECGTIPAP